MSFLLSLILAAPAQVLPGQGPLTTADPVSYFPIDSLVVVDLDLEPYRADGAATQTKWLLGHDGVQEVLGQLPVPPEVPHLLGSYRITTGIGVADLLAGRLLVVFEPMQGAEPLDPTAFGLYPLQLDKRGVQVHASETAGVWCRDGDRTLVLLPIPELGEHGGSFDQQAEWLATRVVASRQLEGHAAGLPSMTGLRQRIESQHDLFRLYVPLDQWTIDNLGLLAGFDPSEMPFDIADLLSPFGLDRIESFGWTTSVEGEWLRDLIYLHGDEPMANIYGGVYPGDGAALAKLEAMPGDAIMASVSRFSLVGMIEGMEQMFENLFGGLGLDLPNDEFRGWIATAKKVAATMGTEVTALQRAEDLWERRNGALWFTLEDPAAFQAALAELPPEFLAMLQQGMDAGPGNYRFGLSVEGDRAYLARSLGGEEFEGTLGQNKAYRRLRPWLAERLASGVVSGFGYVGPETTAEGIDALRRDGLPAELTQILPFEIDFSSLPDFDQVASQLGGTATVSVSDANGMLLETISPIGYLGMILVHPAVTDAIAQSLSGQSPFLANPYDSAYDSEVF